MVVERIRLIFVEINDFRPEVTPEVCSTILDLLVGMNSTLVLLVALERLERCA